jgi:20S proteasome subunit alpha 5
MASLWSSNRLDYGVNTFSPEGRLHQVEYALEAIKLGATAIGIQTQHGVLLAVEKRAEAKLMVKASHSKLFEIDSHIGAVYSGLQADGRSLVDQARVEAQSYWFTYDEAIPLRSLTRQLADYMMSFAGADDDTDENRPKRSRPFGCAILMAGVDASKGPALYVVDPSGTMVQYLATAVGAGGEPARSTLQDKYHKSMTLAEAEDLGAEILKQVMEADIADDTIEMALITADTDAKLKYQLYGQEKLVEIIARLEPDEAEQAVVGAGAS